MEQQKRRHSSGENDTTKRLAVGEMEEDLFFVESEERKFRLVVEDRSLFVAKDSLASLSGFFKLIMYGDSVEAQENTIRLQEKKLDDILQLLHAIFSVPKIRTRISFDNFDLLMSFADEYDISQLRVDGEAFLKAEIARLPVGDEIYLKVGVLANKFWFREIVEICIPHICVFPPDLFDLYKSGFRKTVLLAIAEAKLHRISLSHPCGVCFCGCGCSSPGQLTSCRVCRASHSTRCVCFHEITCKSKSADETDFFATKGCLCGFVFDNTILDD